jgi:hypothetical protein
MDLDQDFAVRAFTLIAGIFAADFIDKALDKCGRIGVDSKDVEYYSCGARSTFATMFTLAAVYGLYTIYQRSRQSPVTTHERAEPTKA